VEAVEVLIKYIVKYQNNFISSYLLLRSMPKLIEKGIKIVELISSNIFNVQFDFDTWPGNHNDNTYCIRAYNGNFFEIRDQYSKIFHDFIPIEKQVELGDKIQKIYKVKYSINLLAQVDMYVDNDKVMQNEEINFMLHCRETD
jgi:hypothetical protein